MLMGLLGELDFCPASGSVGEVFHSRRPTNNNHRQVHERLHKIYCYHCDWIEEDNISPPVYLQTGVHTPYES